MNPSRVRFLSFLIGLTSLVAYAATPATQPTSQPSSPAVGEAVKWTLTVVSVRPAPDDKGFIVLTTRESGWPVAVRLRADEKDRALACRIGKPASFSGMILEVHPTIDRTKWDSLFRDAPVSPKGLPGIVMNGTPPTTPGKLPWKAATTSQPAADVKAEPVQFFEAKTKATNVIFLIDRSGSMIDTFDQVKLEMLRSVGRLQSTQRFRIVLFGQGKPLSLPTWSKTETPPPLTVASLDAKAKARAFLDEVCAEGSTDPSPGLAEAFSAVKGAGDEPAVIFLLTDGVFDDNTRVLAQVAKSGLGKNAAIHTFLYGNQPAEAVDVMTRIAKRTGGEYHFVKAED